MQTSEASRSLSIEDIGHELSIPEEVESASFLSLGRLFSPISHGQIISSFVDKGISQLHPWQARCIDAFIADENLRTDSSVSNLVYSAPTSGGKTLVAVRVLGCRLDDCMIRMQSIRYCCCCVELLRRVVEVSMCCPCERLLKKKLTS